MTLTREQILAARQDRRPVPLEVPEWGGMVYLRYLTVADQAELYELNTEAEMPVAVLLASVCDAEGNRIFEESDREELSKEAFAIVLRVFAAAAKLNGLTSKELEEAMESFGAIRSGVEANGSDSLLVSPTPESSQVGS